MTTNTAGFEPLGHKLLVEPLSVEKTTSSGIVLAMETTNKDEMAQIVGTVIAVGPAAWSDNAVQAWAAPGDRVLFAKYAGLLWNGADGKKYRVINDLDIVGKVTS